MTASRSIAGLLISTWFGCGYAPKGPGTAGSLAALAIAWLLHRYAGVPPLGFGLMGVLLSGPAIWAAGATAKDTGLKDPQIVVVDEVVGQWITLAGAGVLDWKSWLAALALFRLFDIWKPPPRPGNWNVWAAGSALWRMTPWPAFTARLRYCVCRRVVQSV